MVVEIGKERKPSITAAVTTQRFANISTPESNDGSLTMNNIAATTDQWFSADIDDESNNFNSNSKIQDVHDLPGYRFCPTDEELIVFYLKKKICNQPLPFNKIVEVNLYAYDPDFLSEYYTGYGGAELYIFTPRQRKYPNGNRPNRAADNGYWKATGADREIKSKGTVVGYRKTLNFFMGRPPKGHKTNWIMHEYTVKDPPPSKRGSNGMGLDDWVLCRIYNKQLIKLTNTQTEIILDSTSLQDDHDEGDEHIDQMNSGFEGAAIAEVEVLQVMGAGNNFQMPTFQNGFQPESACHQYNNNAAPSTAIFYDNLQSNYDQSLRPVQVVRPTGFNRSWMNNNSTDQNAHKSDNQYVPNDESNGYLEDILNAAAKPDIHSLPSDLNFCYYSYSYPDPSVNRPGDQDPAGMP
ncbi:hypothetical protein I3842_Q093800 [Carya illinoinensis]|uniref:NAC domain-containing protein n=1 Tax=Carya illinoinensis TaxID=32201 RepID=A0A922D2K1_CARIL|nr:hypothetical protein I3842_Q093800 [Carya illinoinensis]